MEFLEETRRRRGVEMISRKLIISGYIYSKHRDGARGSSFWHCVKRMEAGCKGRVRVEQGEENYVVVHEHSHLPSFGEAKAKAAVAGLKRRAADELHTAPSTLTQQLLGNVDSETLVALPREEPLKNAVKRVRRANLPQLPKTLGDLQVLPAEYSMVDGEMWLFYDSGIEADVRVLAFSRRRTLAEMGRSSQWFLDGTFKARPLLFSQLYVIHYAEDGHVLPGIFALMSQRSEAAYGMLFEAIRENLPEENKRGPARFSMDFEVAASTAMQEVFDNSAPSFCYFHFTQSLWRRMQQSGAAAAYMQAGNEELRSQFHAALALAFVPEEHVTAAFMALREAADVQMDDVLDLLEDYYVLGRRRGRGRRPPRFPIQTWNVYQRTLDSLNRTNNTPEGWNRRFNTIIGKKHPNLYACLSSLQDEERNSENQRRLVRLGEPPPTEKSKECQK